VYYLIRHHCNRLETIRTEFFTAGGEIRLRSRVIERDVVVLDRGTAVLRA
jgi:hypothetical protein